MGIEEHEQVNEPVLRRHLHPELCDLPRNRSHDRVIVLCLGVEAYLVVLTHELCSEGGHLATDGCAHEIDLERVRVEHIHFLGELIRASLLDQAQALVHFSLEAHIKHAICLINY